MITKVSQYFFVAFDNKTVELIKGIIYNIIKHCKTQRSENYIVMFCNVLFFFLNISTRGSINEI
ncbi:hypothetical protein psyc5s11_04940 [Clostridium gelidum]|uniref:Uncharacterized protein n=1 Tax=Clostridium gelidum TaxID=704125 RepID=A0ABN6IR13_9CLOT|nr:hypothetical protein psyc5s11_04940 [Clostridium gelidum]